MHSKSKGLGGPSIQVDPAFPYYQGRSPASVAEEIQLAGYDIVHYFVVNEHVVNRGLIEAFHDRGMFVWAMVIGNGTFSTERFPSEWPSWRMELLKPVEDGFVRFSPFCEAYCRWKRQAIAELVYRYPFDGIEIAEPYFPEWDGIRRGVYGDVGSHAAKAFRSAYGLDIPDFVNAGSARYYKKIPDVYDKWVSFRVDAVNGFVDDMMNGSGGAREARPDIAVATWSLAVDGGTDSVARLREMQGLCASAMISKVRPDVHFLQTHWPDWIRGDLPADYVRRYVPFVEEIRAAHPSLPLGVQADIGSGRTMIKNGAWWRAFQENARQLGYSTCTAYEYHIGGYMYEDRPMPAKAVRTSWNEIAIAFNKVIDETSCQPPEAVFRVYRGDTVVPVTLQSVKVDGNRIVLRSEHFPDRDVVVELLGRVRDTPKLWLYRDRNANESMAGTQVVVQVE